MLGGLPQKPTTNLASCLKDTCYACGTSEQATFATGRARSRWGGLAAQVPDYGTLTDWALVQAQARARAAAAGGGNRGGGPDDERYEARMEVDLAGEFYCEQAAQLLQSCCSIFCKDIEAGMSLSELNVACFPAHTRM